MDKMDKMDKIVIAIAQALAYAAAERLSAKPWSSTLTDEEASQTAAFLKEEVTKFLTDPDSSQKMIKTLTNADIVMKRAVDDITAKVEKRVEEEILKE